LRLYDPKRSDLVVAKLTFILSRGILWRAQPVDVALFWEELRLGVKGYPNCVIAGFPRKLCK